MKRFRTRAIIKFKYDATIMYDLSPYKIEVHGMQEDRKEFTYIKTPMGDNCIFNNFIGRFLHL